LSVPISFLLLPQRDAARRARQVEGFAQRVAQVAQFAPARTAAAPPTSVIRIVE
jgi:hypothetical protein